jgi:hypothetical protein
MNAVMSNVKLNFTENLQHYFRGFTSQCTISGNSVNAVGAAVNAQ